MKKKRRRSRSGGQKSVEFKSFSQGAALNDAPRKSTSWLTLVIMGGTGMALLHSCRDQGEEQTIFASSNECTQAGYSLRACEAQEQAAQQQLDASSQGFDNSYACQNYYGLGNCHYSLVTHHFLPRLAGFTMGKRPQEDSQGASSSGGGYYGGGRAFYRDPNDRETLRTPGSEARWTRSSADADAHKFSGRTVSRGGFGGSSYHRSGG